MQLLPILFKSYWILAGIGGLWALFVASLINPTIQRHTFYAHKLHSGSSSNVSNPEAFGFAKGQVTPFHLNTSDGETLFCWHVLPLDVYLDNEQEIVKGVGGIADDFTETIGAKLMLRDPESRVVVNFHGNSGHVAIGHRPATYRSMISIPHTHLLTCDYRGFGKSTLRNAPHIPTEPGLINDGISLISYLLTTLQHPASRTVLLGQSLGTAVTTATALYFTDPTSEHLPSSLVRPTRSLQAAQSFAGVILVSPFPDITVLLKTYKIKGYLPILSPLRHYPKIEGFMNRQILDHWPTLLRLEAILAVSRSSKIPVHVTMIHARNDIDIDFRLSENMYAGLESAFRSEAPGAVATEERRSILGAEGVKRGAWAYRSVEAAEGASSLELEIVRYGGHYQVVGFPQVNLAVRRAWGRKSLRPGLDVE